MTSFEEAETEETAACLHMTFYHPCQDDKMMFRCLNFCKREQVRADEMAKFGRDPNICHYNLVDTRVSRIQFSLQFYRKQLDNLLFFGKYSLQSLILQFTMILPMFFTNNLFGHHIIPTF
uniref:TRAF interacting protein with forkhead associated domain n=1 Tax=Anas platyrhynchos platyrhynchos TaxID=8840 RepID=A0A493T681_ANAPP